MSQEPDQTVAFVGGEAIVRIALSVYTRTAAMKAAHDMSGTAYASLDQDGNEYLICRLRPKRSMDNIEHIAGQFLNALLDHRLRETLAEKTEPIRRLLLAQAFSAVNLLHPEFNRERSSDSNAASNNHVTAGDQQ
jgi:His-Xaa-Ser system protein HxsD